ncbi:hypothetical protein LA52FAK_16210 [Desulforhopalus sp. 52FAK]
MKPAMNSRFELTGYTMARLLKICALGKIVPIGNLRGGPGGRCLLVVSLLHYFGYWGYLVKAKHGHRLGRVKSIVQRVRK